MKEEPDTKDYIKTIQRKINGRWFYVDQVTGFCFAKKGLTIEYIYKDGVAVPIEELLKT